mmetsp:Transcript_16707/g.38774  ORF Transcript_16707/g.38774 Transcript_16707/m.38774 type:complete len:243 (+) Transcript_16707:64-792(+)
MIRCGLVAVSLPLLAFGFGTLPHVKLASRQPSALFSEEASADDASSDASTSEEEQAASPPSEDTSDILNSPAFLTRKVEVLQSDIAAMEKEIEEANALYTAGKAEWGDKFDMLNKESQLMQERFAEQGAQGKETATVEVAQKILNVLDNYDRAFQSVEAATNEEVEIVDAYKNTYDMILDAFSELNVTKVETVGTEFDYEMHQAMMQMPSDEYEEGIVCQEFAMGWKCGEKLIRPAMVAVAA